MTHEDVFFQDILADHDDDTPRRIYADWLLDRPDPVQSARGELIHVQLDLARAEPGSPRRSELAKQERRLLDQHGREWGSVYRRLGCACWEYVRGFVEGIGAPLSAFLSQAPALFRAAPIREVKLYGAASGMAELARCPFLSRVHTLDLERNELGDAEIEDLARSDRLGELRTLLLWSNRIGDTGAPALASMAAPKLRRLDLSANVIGDTGAAALAPMLGRLRHLDLAANQIGDEGAFALAAARADGLEVLTVTKNPIGATGQTLLRERFGARVYVLG
jgi:uncharacterized protein (TIGR02996 family)